MRKLLLSLFVLAACYTSNAQTTATFESLTLPKADTAYINYSSYGSDVGFSDGLAYFPCVYDTSFGYEFWAGGFAYSNMTDSITSGFMNQYSAKTAKGFAASSNYVVAYGQENTVRLTGAATGKSMLGFYITNSTYAYNSMRSGDGFSKKFNATDKDYFRLDVFAYRKDTLGKDSVSFYLADFRNTDSTKNYIVRDWQWVDLAKIGKADSLYFRLQSTDNGSFGMNTPAYFCMDNFMTNETGLSIASVSTKADIKIFPNPATDKITIESSIGSKQGVTVTDFSGRIVAVYEMNEKQLIINLEGYAPGTYILNFTNGNQSASSRFVKQ
ncbi:MAG: DUF4465 domain-containing protein [Bacteroidota bacterium]